MFTSLLATVAVAGSMAWGAIIHPGQLFYPPMPHASSTPPMMATSSEYMHGMPPQGGRMSTSTRPNWREGSSTPPMHHPWMGTSTMPHMHGDMRMNMGSGTTMHMSGDMNMGTSTDMQGSPLPPPGFFHRLFRFL